jgi:hypothetical protein
MHVGCGGCPATAPACLQPRGTTLGRWNWAVECDLGLEPGRGEVEEFEVSAGANKAACHILGRITVLDNSIEHGRERRTAAESVGPESPPHAPLAWTSPWTLPGRRHLHQAALEDSLDDGNLPWGAAPGRRLTARVLSA